MGEGRALAMMEGVRKIPEPMTEPVAIMVMSNRVSLCFSCDPDCGRKLFIDSVNIFDRSCYGSNRSNLLLNLVYWFKKHINIKM